MQTEDEIIKKAQEGDQDAYEQIIQKYKSVVRSIANSYFLIGADKEDLLQEGMYGLFKAVKDYKSGINSFCTFAYTCVLRQVLNAVKRYSGAKNKALTYYEPLDNQVVQGLTVPLDDPIESLLAKERLQMLTDKIKTNLSSYEQSVVTLFVSGFSYEEIASKLNKSVKSVDGALQRVRKKLTD